MSMGDTTAAEKLKQLRKRLHVTQQTFAESVGYGQSYYATVESGLRGLSMPMMQKICKVYGLSAAYFLDGEPAADLTSAAAEELRSEIAGKLESCDAPLLRRISGIIDLLQS